MSRLSRSVWLVVWIAALAFAAPTAGGDWPHWRGPTQDGRAPESGLFGDTFGLALDWSAPLGSGYSGMTVALDRVVTMYSDGEADHLAAFDVTSGEQLWRYRIDTTYKGHDGSDDGPLSTPVIDEGMVYGLGPKGKLFAVRLENGEELWSLDLGDDFGAGLPDYGYTTTPLVEGSCSSYRPVGRRVGRSRVWTS